MRVLFKIIATSVCALGELCSRLRELVDMTVFASEVLEVSLS
jgi:hypothetical protein